jgi:MFS family permease
MHPRHAHPIVFLFLIAPFGMMSGFLTVTLAYVLAQAGVSTEQIAGLIAVSYIPHSWKFLWAPIADTTLSRKTWYLLAVAVSMAGVLATGAVPATAASLPLLTIVVLVSNVTVTFLMMSVESFMAYGTLDAEKGRAGGWFQAGNLGGLGVGGGAGLWMAQVLPAPWMPGAVLAAAGLACSLALQFVPEPQAAHRGETFVRNLANVLKDLWTIARSRFGYLALLICFLPIGTGAASNLWSAVAGDWHASAGTVALVNGVFGGIVSAIGCIAGGYLCDRMNRKTAYCAYGLLQAMCAVAMAIAPRTEFTYIVFTMVYWFITGLTYAAFSAVVLEAIGHGAAATKYSLFASLSNMPIGYMTFVDGWAHGKWGPDGMLFTEAAIGMAGLAVFIAVVSLKPGRRAKAAAIP